MVLDIYTVHAICKDCRSIPHGLRIGSWLESSSFSKKISFHTKLPFYKVITFSHDIRLLLTVAFFQNRFPRSSVYMLWHSSLILEMVRSLTWIKCMTFYSLLKTISLHRNSILFCQLKSIILNDTGDFRHQYERFILRFALFIKIKNSEW